MCASSRKGLLDGEEPQLAALDEHGKLGLPLCKRPNVRPSVLSALLQGRRDDFGE